MAALGADARALVLSARRRTLFAFERESAGERRRVRALDLVDRRWNGLDEEGAPLGHVLAATYSPVDDALYVLDEIPARPGRSRARLVRLELELGATRGTVLAEWPRATTNDRFALTVDPAGALYLAGTQAGARLSVVRLESGRRGHEPTGFVLRAERFIEEGLGANVPLVLFDAATPSMTRYIARQAELGMDSSVRDAQLLSSTRRRSHVWLRAETSTTRARSTNGNMMRWAAHTTITKCAASNQTGGMPAMRPVTVMPSSDIENVGDTTPSVSSASGANTIPVVQTSASQRPRGWMIGVASSRVSIASIGRTSSGLSQRAKKP